MKVEVRFCSLFIVFIFDLNTSLETLSALIDAMISILETKIKDLLRENAKS